MRTRVFSTRAAAALAGLALLGAACSPPLAATPTAAPTAAPKPTTAPAAAPPAAQAAKPTAAPATSGQSAQQPAEDAMLAAAVAKYYEPAKQEGKLVVYGVGTEALFRPVKEAFEKRFPGIQVQGVDQRGRETREKLIAEQQSKNYVADVAISGQDTQQAILDLGFSENFLTADTDDVIPGLIQPDKPVNPRTVTVFTWAANTNLVPPDQEPKTWKDLLDPKWKGKLAMDDVRGSGPGGSILAGLEKVYGEDFTKQLAAQDIFFATQAGPLIDAISRGERAIFLSSGHPDVIAARKAGAPIKQLRPTDGVSVTQISQTLIKNAPHPNAGKLWIEWSISEQGQDLLASQGYASVRQGTKPAEPEASLAGLKILPRDDDQMTAGVMADRSKRWESLFFKK